MKNDSNLWHLVKTELNYRKTRILTAYGTLVAFFILRSLLQSGLDTWPEDIPFHIHVMLVWTFAMNAFVAHSLFSAAKVEKRDRFFAAMPIPPRAMVISRMLGILLVHMIPLTIWLIALGIIRITWGYEGEIILATFPPTVATGTVWTLISTLALSLYMSLLIMTAHSVRKSARVNFLFWLGALLFTSFFVYPAGSSPEVFLPGLDAFTSPWGTLYFGLIVGGFMYLNLILFRRRRSFCG